MAITTQTQIKANLIAAGLSGIAGSKPTVSYPPGKDYAIISFDSVQQKNIRSYLDKQFTDNTGKPSDVQINFEPVIYPYVAKKVLPFAIGLIVLGYIIAKVR